MTIAARRTSIPSNAKPTRLAVDQRDATVVAIASGGGHWQQLMRLRPALDMKRAMYITTDPGYARDVPGHELFVVTDANKSTPWKLMQTLWQVAFRIFATRPDVVISTGAAPGVFGILAGRLVGARTIWIDSIANAHSISLSGRIVLRFAHVTLTQWPHLVQSDSGLRHEGSVL